MALQEVAVSAGNPHLVTRRHCRQTMHDRCLGLADLACEVARDTTALRQYYSLREKVYTATWRLTDFDGSEDDFDRRGHIVIARTDDEVVGGVRLNFRRPGERNPLPLEHAGFDLDRILFEYNLGDKIGGEISRLALHPRYWGGEPSTILLRSLHSFALNQGMDYALCVSPLAQARNYYRIARKMPSVREYLILGNAGVPDRPGYEGISMVLSMMKLGR